MPCTPLLSCGHSREREQGCPEDLRPARALGEETQRMTWSAVQSAQWHWWSVQCLWGGLSLRGAQCAGRATVEVGGADVCRSWATGHSGYRVGRSQGAVSWGGRDRGPHCRIPGGYCKFVIVEPSKLKTERKLCLHVGFSWVWGNSCGSEFFPLRAVVTAPEDQESGD